MQFTGFRKATLDSAAASSNVAFLNPVNCILDSRTSNICILVSNVRVACMLLCYRSSSCKFMGTEKFTDIILVFAFEVKLHIVYLLLFCVYTWNGDFAVMIAVELSENSFKIRDIFTAPTRIIYVGWRQEKL